MEIRPSTPADTGHMLRVRTLAEQAFRVGRDMVVTDEARTLRYLALPDAFGLVAQTPTQIVGFALAMDGWVGDDARTVNPGLCHIAAVFVVPEHWNRRVGTQLVVALLNAARERGYTQAQLWTQDYNTRAQRLYESQGFRPSQRSKIDERGDRIVLYSRPL